MKEFEKLVRAKTIPELHPYIPMALEVLGDSVQSKRYTVPDIIETVGRLVSVLERMEVAKPEQDEVPAKPSVTSEFLSDLITPWIEDIRQEIFNTRVIPFRTKEALNWMKQEQVDMKNWRDEVEREIEKLPKWMRGWPFNFLNKPNLEKRPLLVLLYDRAEEVAKVTGFNHFSVMSHIILGAPLTLNKVDTKAKKEIHKLPSGAELVNRFVTMQIRGELTFDELRHLYQQIRQDLGVKRSKALKEKHLELYQIVRRKGGAPKGKGTVAFWESVRKDMNEKNPTGNPYTTWKGVKRAYDLLWNKLRSQYLVEGGKRR